MMQNQQQQVVVGTQPQEAKPQQRRTIEFERSPGFEFGLQLRLFHKQCLGTGPLVALEHARFSTTSDGWMAAAGRTRAIGRSPTQTKPVRSDSCRRTTSARLC